MLTAAQTQAILDGCTRLRDRLLFAVLLDTGMRIGEALGLRPEDLGIAERQVMVVPRVNDNRARAKRSHGNYSCHSGCVGSSSGAPTTV